MGVQSESNEVTDTRHLTVGARNQELRNFRFPRVPKALLFASLAVLLSCLPPSSVPTGGWLWTTHTRAFRRHGQALCARLYGANIANPSAGGLDGLRDASFDRLAQVSALEPFLLHTHSLSHRRV